MAEQQKQSLCPRLIDYLAIVGARSGTIQRSSGSNNNQSPVQVSKFSELLILFERIREFFSRWLAREQRFVSNIVDSFAEGFIGGENSV